MLCLDILAGLVDKELHFVEFQQQVIREFNVCLVDLIDQQHHLLVCIESFPQLALVDVILDVVHTIIAQL